MTQMADTLKTSIFHTINHISEDPNDVADNTKKISANVATTNTLKQEIQELREMIKMLVEDKKQKPSKLQKNLSNIVGRMGGVPIMAHSVNLKPWAIRMQLPSPIGWVVRTKIVHPNDYFGQRDRRI